MTKRWQSLYLYSANTPHIVSALSESLVTLGYTPYNPFGGALPPVYVKTAKTFIAPPQQGWTRILSEDTLDAALLLHLSQIDAVLYTQLNDTDCEIVTAKNGEKTDPQVALTPLLHESVTESMLVNALSGKISLQSTSQTKQDDAIPLDVLQDDMRTMANNLNNKHIGKMFNKLMKGVGRRVAGDSDAALDLLRSGSVDWTGAGGRQIQALMNCLTIPDTYWRVPDFVTLRDAYQLHQRKQKNPKAMLYPGDAEAMQAVPDALNYTPVYGGISA